MKYLIRNLIYGLVDPRSLLVHYVGMSSRGYARALEHQGGSPPAMYSPKARWISSLQALGIGYHVVLLEVVRTPSELAEAERRWIAYGRLSGWPLTNTTDGGEGRPYGTRGKPYKSRPHKGVEKWTAKWRADSDVRSKLEAARASRFGVKRGRSA